MDLRPLGRTGLYVSAIGLGTEYLNGLPQETVVSVVRKAIGNGINYFNLVFNLSAYLDNFSVAIKGQREKIMFTVRLGSAEKNGRYRKTRNVKECKEVFLGT